jgi:hypothetical protein
MRSRRPGSRLSRCAYLDWTTLWPCCTQVLTEERDIAISTGPFFIAKPSTTITPLSCTFIVVFCSGYMYMLTYWMIDGGWECRSTAVCAVWFT